MDEYIGLDLSAPQRFSNFLDEKIFSKKNFKSINILNMSNDDLDKECEKYSNLLLKYSPDIVCMGIGENGHIAFNDPHVAKFDDKKLVKIVQLDYKCREQQVNDGCFCSINNVATHALTLTIPALMNANNIFCIVPAKSKAAAVKDTVTAEVCEDCPATILRTHNSVILYLDNDSSYLLNNV